MKSKEEILSKFPEKIRLILEKEDFSKLEEIRLRSDRHIVVTTNGIHRQLDYMTAQNEIEQTLHIISQSSVYAYIEEIKSCFITLQGGHRVGLCGRAVVKDGEVCNIVQLSGINFRIARQVKGSANAILPYIVQDGIKNTLIISPPQCGKTTMLRDIARQIGKRYKVSIIDERGEIAAMHRGIPQYDVGEMTDVLDLCPKNIGISLMLRSMSPDVIITDEIAAGDIEAIGQAFSCGVKIIATAHGDNVSQVLKRINLDPIAHEIGCVITLSRKKGVGTIESIGSGLNISKH